MLYQIYWDLTFLCTAWLFRDVGFSLHSQETYKPYINLTLSGLGRAGNSQHHDGLNLGVIAQVFTTLDIA